MRLLSALALAAALSAAFVPRATPPMRTSTVRHAEEKEFDHLVSLVTDPSNADAVFVFNCKHGDYRHR